MGKKTTKGPVESSVLWQSVEEMARRRIELWLQDLLEHEVTEFLGRSKSQRCSTVDATLGYRNGHGKPRRLTLRNGTVTLRRPRLRDTEEKFESCLLPLFVRRTPEVNALLPELYLHGLAEGDMDLDCWETRRRSRHRRWRD
jgi:transposase-like protein